MTMPLQEAARASGFARQSGGTVRIHSHPGQGTSVKIYLPAAEPQRTDAPRGSGQTGLVIEDDDSVRLLVQEGLTELGYDAVLASDLTISLMISDVGLPGMTGRELIGGAPQPG